VRSRAGYWIGGGLIVVGVVGAIAWAVLTGAHLVDTIDDFQHVAIPGREQVLLEQRKYVLYVEGPGADENVPAIEVAVSDARRETPVAVRRYSGSLSYSFDTAGAAVATVTAPRAGRYSVRTGGPDGYRLAIGESIASNLVRTIVGALAIGAVLGIAGVMLLIVTGVRRSRARLP
jgi:hypothetical protein